jgi:hypothetical protein
MGGRVVEFHKRLVRLLELHGRGRQRKLVVIEPPLDVEISMIKFFVLDDLPR